KDGIGKKASRRNTDGLRRRDGKVSTFCGVVAGHFQHHGDGFVVGRKCTQFQNERKGVFAVSQFVYIDGGRTLKCNELVYRIRWFRIVFTREKNESQQDDR